MDSPFKNMIDTFKEEIWKGKILCIAFSSLGQFLLLDIYKLYIVLYFILYFTLCVFVLL